MSFTRLTPLLRQRLFTSSARARHVISMEDAAAAHLTATANVVPRLGRVARWYLPTMAAVALGMIYLPQNFTSTETSRRTARLPAANASIGFGISTALNEANRNIQMGLEPTQEEKNMILMDSYGERSSLEDMERAIAGLEAKPMSQKHRNVALAEAYGDRSSLKDMERAMEMYEVQ
ncbi:uncharacterized protein K460DRAFT_363578 [Cucurbitaria berberidis CBS 394.84]|uniref:Uncharacterized protein n=1 Tax=Cucurbitaria berberidis CBS 394.84 TaxID=1168544 RepID=A0A9P4LAL9_9PLEO|nr:uncharacterized protein K460DRAFT_363578 [Cucurbitaria berberidis CBS 394.84]KAF1847507.1 hypothetical protein K460DRAFT_363578 [Cucurbitaria berberidis CBS 394.84]